MSAWHLIAIVFRPILSFAGLSKGKITSETLVLLICGKRVMELSGYRVVWIIAMFDLPTDTITARKDYAAFRKNLLKDGFAMLQYSVYIRHCASEENAAVHFERVRRFLPPEGEVRLLMITDKQYGRIETYWGSRKKPVPPGPRQLELFVFFLVFSVASCFLTVG